MVYGQRQLTTNARGSVIVCATNWTLTTILKKKKNLNKGKFIAYFSLINGYPVCGGKPFVTSDVPNTIL